MDMEAESEGGNSALNRSISSYQIFQRFGSPIKVLGFHIYLSGLILLCGVVTWIKS